MKIPIKINSSIKDHLDKKDIVVLESAVLTHGLPYSQNEQTSLDLEEEVRSAGSTPATIGLIEGEIIIGLSKDEIHHLAQVKPVRKISQRDFGIALAQKLNGGTTVAGTIIAAQHAGIQVFATGGIGGVHRGSVFDVSADLQVLSQYPMIVVCAGAKSILDLPATLEKLETLGVPVLGYQTDDFPAFFSITSGLGVDRRVDSPREIVEIAKAHWNMGLRSSILVVVPPPAEHAIPFDEINEQIEKAVAEAERKNIHGAKVTPFLLEKTAELTKGSSMRVNLDLLRNNAYVAGLIAKELAKTNE